MLLQTADSAALLQGEGIIWKNRQSPNSRRTQSRQEDCLD